MGEALLNSALKSVTSERKKSQFFVNSIQELPSELFNEKEENKRDNLFTKLKKQTTKAINNLFQGESLSENLKEEEDSNKEEEDEEVFDENTLKKTVDFELKNLKEDSYIDSDEDSGDESMVASSSNKINERKERKKIDMNFLKSKRKTISMRLAFLSACKTFKFFLLLLIFFSLTILY